MVYHLSKKAPFPDPRLMPVEDRESDGLYAIGGDLSIKRLVEAYLLGIFPWSDFRSGNIEWYCPWQRFVIFPDEIHISHSMRSLINKGRFHVTYDQDFEDVIINCSLLRINERGAWLGENMVKAYLELHHAKIAHSVEVWDNDKLVGGLYGVVINRCFFGESMFSLMPNASKLALIRLAQDMAAKNGVFIDCQFETSHLRSMGGRYIPYEEFMRLLHDGYTAPQ